MGGVKEGFECDFECMADPEKLAIYEQRVAAMMERIKPGDTVVVACHKDGDGLPAGTFVLEFLKAFFGDNINIRFCHDIPSSQEFYLAACTANHVIAADLWIDNSRESQRGLVRLLEEGRNITVIDHHDERFDEFDIMRPSLGDEIYDPRKPETMRSIVASENPGELLYVSPTRLGSAYKSSDTPAAMITYKILCDLAKNRGVDMAKLEPLLLLAMGGDYAEDTWTNLRMKYQESERAGAYFGKLLNAADNLKNPHELIESMRRNPNIQDLARLPHIEALFRIDQWIDSKTTEFGGEQKDIILYHVSGDDEEDLLSQDQSDLLVPHPVLHKRLADRISETHYGQKTVIVTQFTRGENGTIKSIRVSARDGQSGENHHMGHLMANLVQNGGGHENAGGADIEIPSDVKPEEALFAIQSRIIELLEQRGMDVSHLK